MRGAESGQQVLFSYVAIDARIPADHPLRAMKQLLEPVLAELAPRFAAMYAEGGRPSIPPEQLLRALLLQALAAPARRSRRRHGLGHNTVHDIAR